MGPNADLPTRFEALLQALERERDDAGGLASRLDEVITLGRALLDAYDFLDATLAAREDQIALQQEVIRRLGLPLIQIRSDALCAPIIGELDADRAARLTDAMLRSATERGVDLVVIDLTGASISDASTVKLLADVVGALQLVGVRGVLSGVTPEAAATMVQLPGGLGPVSCYATVARAVEAHAQRRSKENKMS